jgi:hypothetical protein
MGGETEFLIKGRESARIQRQVKQNSWTDLTEGISQWFTCFLKALFLHNLGGFNFCTPYLNSPMSF